MRNFRFQFFLAADSAAARADGPLRGTGGTGFDGGTTHYARWIASPSAYYGTIRGDQTV